MESLRSHQHTDNPAMHAKHVVQRLIGECDEVGWIVPLKFCENTRNRFPSERQLKGDPDTFEIELHGFNNRRTNTNLI